MSVIIPEKFAARIDADKLEELKAQGLLVSADKTLNSVDLVEPSYGEKVVGVLTPEEERVFISFYHISMEVADISQGMAGDQYIGLGKAMKEKRDSYSPNLTEYSDTIRKLFRLTRIQGLLEHTLYWALGERFDCHDRVIGIRKGGRVVVGRSKWDDSGR